MKKRFRVGMVLVLVTSFALAASGQESQRTNQFKCDKPSWVYRKNAEEHYRIASEDRTIDFWGKTFTTSLGLLAIELYRVCAALEDQQKGGSPAR